jgi:hypothetical protein
MVGRTNGNRNAGVPREIARAEAARFIAAVPFGRGSFQFGNFFEEPFVIDGYLSIP